MATRITLPADVHQIDATGYVWTFLDEADTPGRITVGSVVVAGDSEDPFLARVIDIVAGSSGREIVHLDVYRWLQIDFEAGSSTSRINGAHPRPTLAQVATAGDPSVNTEFHLEDLGANRLGQQGCDDGIAVIRINDSLGPEPNYGPSIEDVAAHEYGHALGLMHQGSGDPLLVDSHVPIMGTCLPPNRPDLRNNVDQLDWSEYSYGPQTSDPFLTAGILSDPTLIDPNGDQSRWSRLGTTYDIYDDPNHRSGVFLLEPAVDTPAGLRQRIDTWGLDGQTYRAVLGYKRASDVTGAIRVELSYRNINPQASADPNCQFFEGWDLNGPVSRGSWQLCATTDIAVTQTDSDFVNYTDTACELPVGEAVGYEVRLQIWKASDHAVFIDHANVMRVVEE